MEGFFFYLVFNCFLLAVAIVAERSFFNSRIIGNGFLSD